MKDNTEMITDDQIKILALQRLLIYYENLAKRNNKQDHIVDTSQQYIAKIRRTLIRMLEKPVDHEEIKIESYK